MLYPAFKITSLAVMQILLLAAVGYFLVRRKILGDSGLDTLSRLVIEVTLPIMIFCQLIKEFSFTLYPDWWVFPLVSMAITFVGFLAGLVFIGLIHGREHRLQFLSLVMFQNSGYLPLALVAALLPPDKTGLMFIYLFLFLFGFNLLIWSVGVYILSFHRAKKFELGSIFSPPVAAVLFSLGFVFLGLNRFVPEFIFKPLKAFGDCTLPLAMLVVGGNLAQIRLGRIDKKAIFLVALVKLIILPALGLWLVIKFRFPELMALLILMQLAMPPATSLSVILRHYKKEDLLISQGIFFGHILSLVTISVFLSLYFTLAVIK